MPDTTTSTPRRSRTGTIALGVVVAAIAIGALAAWRLSAKEDPMASSPTPTVTYGNDTLTVAGTTLSDFPGYETFTGQTIPAGWLARTSLVIQSKTDPINAPTVAAAVFADNQQVADNPERQLSFSEQEFGLDPAYDVEGGGKAVSETIAQGDRAGSGRHCYYRIRSGRMNGPDGPEMLLGTVIAVSTDQPSIGLTIDGGTDSNVKDLTEKVVDNLCR
jgi:hypothetical protein